MDICWQCWTTLAVPIVFGINLHLGAPAVSAVSQKLLDPRFHYSYIRVAFMLGQLVEKLYKAVIEQHYSPPSTQVSIKSFYN